MRGDARVVTSDQYGREAVKGKVTDTGNFHGGALPATAVGDVSGVLTSQLAALNGEVAGIEVAAGAEGTERPTAGGPAKKAPYTALSGGEFLLMREEMRDGGQLPVLTGGIANAPNLRVLPGGLPNSLQGVVKQFADEPRELSREPSRKQAHAAVTAGDAGDFALAAQAAGVEKARSAGESHPSMSAPVEVAGHVVQGTMSRDRLSTESVLNMSAGIREFAAAGGNGELRVRLKPDNLGELQVRVVTRGNDVGVQIRASDERSKAILEESLSHLRESLASQNLNLSSVDLSVKPSTAQGLERAGFDALGAQARQAGQDGGSQGNSNRWTRSGPDQADQEATVIRMPSRAAAGGALAGVRRAAGGSGRLDLMV